MTAVTASLVVLERDVWEPRAQAHAARVDAWTAGRLQRAARGQRHPVEDFLFEYYPTRAGQLRRWHPGLGVGLVDAPRLAEDPAYHVVDVAGRDVVTVDVARFAHRRDGLAWVEGLVRRTAERAGRWGCFGLHEWAMVYGLEQDEVLSSPPPAPALGTGGAAEPTRAGGRARRGEDRVVRDRAAPADVPRRGRERGADRVVRDGGADIRDRTGQRRADRVVRDGGADVRRRAGERGPDRIVRDGAAPPTSSDGLDSRGRRRRAGSCCPRRRPATA
ncbi:MAG: hypothetical protein U0R76_06600 [Candidatus Nanopelagicales bacterium]